MPKKKRKRQCAHCGKKDAENVHFRTACEQDLCSPCYAKWKDITGIEGPGRGWHGDEEGHSKAGKIGGRHWASIPGYMAALGRKGGQAKLEQYGVEELARMGKKGGKARAAKAGPTKAQKNSTGRHGGVADLKRKLADLQEGD